MVWVALLRLLIAAGGHAAVAGAGRVQRRVVLTGPPADHSGWTLTSATWRASPPQATAQTALAPPHPGREPVPKTPPKTGVRIGYARCSTDKQDLTAQRHAVRHLGVSDDRLYLDHGMTGRDRRRPGVQQALAAVRQGDTLVVPKLDRLARSVPDARAIGDSLAAGGVRLSIGGTVYDPADPMGKMFFNILATFAEFEVDLLRMLAREGMAIARAKGRLKGKAPKLSARQRAHVLGLVRAGANHVITVRLLAALALAPPTPAISRQASTSAREEAIAASASAAAASASPTIITRRSPIRSASDPHGTTLTPAPSISAANATPSACSPIP